MPTPNCLLNRQIQAGEREEMTDESERLKRLADAEDGCIVSTGGLVTDLERLAMTKAVTMEILEDYRNAPSGVGPLAPEWKDKPHRLVYDLIDAITTIIRERDEAVEQSRISDGTTKTMVEGAQKLSDEIAKSIVERDEWKASNEKLAAFVSKRTNEYNAERDSLAKERDDAVESSARNFAMFESVNRQCDEWNKRAEEMKSGILKKWWRWNNAVCWFECLHCDGIQDRQVLLVESFQHDSDCIITRLSSEG